jgi:hypothetical protein
LAVVHLVGSNCSAGDKDKLEYKTGKKDGFKVDVVKVHRNERNIMGTEIVTVSTDKYGYGFTALSSDEEGVRFEVEYLERTHETDDTQFLQGPDFSELIGKKVRFHLSSTGETSGYEGFDELPRIRIADEQKELNEQLYIIDIREFFPGLPEEEVGIGDSWTVSRQYEEPVGESHLTVKIEFRYAVIGRKKIEGYECLMIEGTSHVLVSGDPTLGGVDLVVKMEGDGTESFAFAYTRGMFLNSSSNLKVVGTAENEEVGMTLRFNHDYDVQMTTKFN